MKYLNLMLCGMLACAVANAQTDSTYLDLGRMRARKEFTQTTVIKASDLAQMPFTNLSDAIRLWVNGAYTDKSTVAYVVDGVMISDADVYSIYDIEEITIVQNALSQPNGAGYVQTLALITTKNGNGTKPRFSAAGQFFGVNRKVTGGTYNFNFFNQYNFTGSAKIGKVAVGGSVNFLHDEMPLAKSTGSAIPTVPNLNRFRTHLWAETALGEKSRVSLHLNYAPQFGDGKFATDSAGNNTDAHSMKFNDALINVTLQLQTAFSSALHNKFSAGYTKNKQHGHDEVMYDYFHGSYDSTSFSRLGQFENNVKGHTLFINDNISYNWRLKDWSIEPAVNLNFQAIKYESQNTYAIVAPGLGGASYGSTGQNLKGNIFNATPSLAITYKNIINVQGGIVQDLSKLVQKDYDESKAYPFVNVAANLLPAKTNLSLKLYGSYAKTAAINNLPAYQINDLSTYLDNADDTKSGFPFTNTNVIYSPSMPKNYDQRYQAGTDFSFFKNTITLGYNYLNTSDVSYAQFTYPGGYMIYAGKYTMERHQVSLVGQVLQGGAFKWRTGLFVNFFKNTINFEDLKIKLNQETNSGGWTNRFAYKRLSLGVDLLYVLNAQTVSFGKTEKHNSLLLQNVYLAYAIGVKKHNNWNVYISSRNLADSNIMPLASDQRKFYGGGVKFDF